MPSKIDDGELIRRAREREGLTQSELAALTRGMIPFQTISSYESGSRNVPRLKFFLLGWVLETDFDDDEIKELFAYFGKGKEKATLIPYVQILKALIRIEKLIADLRNLFISTSR